MHTFGGGTSILRLAAVGLLLLGVCGSARAVDWTTNHESAVAAAKKQNRLLVIFFSFDEERRERADKNMTDRRREGVKLAFRDPEIDKLASDSFICVQADWKQDADLKKALGLNPGRNEVLIVSGRGEVQGRVAVPKGSSISHVAEQIREPIKAAMTQARDKLFAEEYGKKVSQVLSDSASKPAELRAALLLAKKHSTDTTEGEVIGLLERADLDSSVRTAAFEVLADLSTPGAVKELVKRSAEYPHAANSLKKCEPAALGTLIDMLKGPADDRFLVVYRAAATIGRYGAQKPDKALKEASAEELAAEIEKLKKVVANRKK